jgi:DNA-damage-inducible protein J
MRMTNISIRTNEDVKKSAEELFESLGLNMTTAVNIFLRQALRVNGLPFSVTANIPNKTTLAAFAEGERLLQDKSSKGYSTIEDLRAALDE